MAGGRARGAGLVCEPRDGRDEGRSRGDRAVGVFPGGVPRGVGGPYGWAVWGSSLCAVFVRWISEFVLCEPSRDHCRPPRALCLNLNLKSKWTENFNNDLQPLDPGFVIANRKSQSCDLRSPRIFSCKRGGIHVDVYYSGSIPAEGLSALLGIGDVAIVLPKDLDLEEVLLLHISPITQHPRNK